MPTRCPVDLLRRPGDSQDTPHGYGSKAATKAVPPTFTELETRAETVMSPSVRSYVAGGAGDEHTQCAGVAAFRGCGLIPRMLGRKRDPSRRGHRLG
jgi:lactate 2-monooxygenase